MELKEILAKLIEGATMVSESAQMLATALEQEAGGSAPADVANADTEEQDQVTDENPDPARKEGEDVERAESESPSEPGEPDEGSTASDSADDRLKDPLTKITEEAISEVARSTASLKAAITGQKKDVDTKLDATGQAMQAIARSFNEGMKEVSSSLKKINGRLDEQENGILNIFNAIGITEDIERSMGNGGSGKPITENPGEYEATVKRIQRDVTGGDKKPADDEAKKPVTARDISRGLAASLVGDGSMDGKF